MSDISDEYIEEKFKELIYTLGEVDWNIIKNETWDEFINKGKKFNKKQIEDLRYFIENFLEELNEEN